MDITNLYFIYSSRSVVLALIPCNFVLLQYQYLVHQAILVCGFWQEIN